MDHRVAGFCDRFFCMQGKNAEGAVFIEFLSQDFFKFMESVQNCVRRYTSIAV